MGTLADFRSWLRLDLNDPASSTQRFSDSDLNRAVSRVVAELSLAWPKVTDSEVVLASASRTVPLPSATFPGLIDVAEVEYPYGAAGTEATHPPTLVPFLVAPDRASLRLLTDDVPAAGARLRVQWTAAHAIGEATTTVPAELDQLLTRGAYGFACLAYGTPAADNFKYEDGATVAGVDDSMIPKAWRERANEALADLRRGLDRLEARRAVGQSVVWRLDSLAPWERAEG